MRYEADIDTYIGRKIPQKKDYSMDGEKEFTPVLVFVYGTLKLAQGNNHVLGNSEFVEECWTSRPDYFMYDGGFPYVSLHGHSYIRGEVWRVKDKNIMKALDRLEGVPHMYVRKQVQVNSVNDFNHFYEVEMYVASPSTEERLQNRRPINLPEIWWPIDKHHKGVEGVIFTND